MGAWNYPVSDIVRGGVTLLAELRLSVLDLASVYEGMSHAEAIRQTIETAQLADELGYDFGIRCAPAAPDPFTCSADRD